MSVRALGVLRAIALMGAITTRSYRWGHLESCEVVLLCGGEKSEHEEMKRSCLGQGRYVYSGSRVNVQRFASKSSAKAIIQQRSSPMRGFDMVEGLALEYGYYFGEFC